MRTGTQRPLAAGWRVGRIAWQGPGYSRWVGCVVLRCSWSVQEVQQVPSGALVMSGVECGVSVMG